MPQRQQGTQIIAEEVGTTGAGKVAGISLVCAPKATVEPDEVRAVVDGLEWLAIAHDATRGPNVVRFDRAKGRDRSWLAFEFVANGLTFDLQWVGTADLVGPGAISHRLDVADGFALDGCRMMRLAPGPHLSGAERSPYVVRTQARIAAALADGLDCVAALVWPPAEALIGREYFARSIGAWVAGGAFPAPGLVTFRKALGGAMQSAGLSYFTGQELRLEGDLAADESTATRLAARLVDQLVHRGALDEAELVTGPNGAPLRLEPSTNRRYVRAWPG